MINPAEIEHLLRSLKSEDESIRTEATEELWRLWFHQKGAIGLEKLHQAQQALESRNIQEAESILTQVIDQQPDFAEAWNRRAVLYYLQGKYRQAIADGQAVMRLNPVHFGALHGLGLCYAALDEFQLAIQAFHRALEIQPYSLDNQRLILECTVRLKP